MTTSVIEASDAGQFLTLPQRILVYIVAAAICSAGLWIASKRPYTPGDDLGYNLGLVGGCMMLSLVLYPLRKRWHLLGKLGSLVAWFRVHIVFGIVGPTLILFHSTFHLGSINGTIAFWAMVVVAISGVVGRYIYLHVHAHLDGHHASMKEMERYLEKRADNAQHALDLAPRVRDWLDDYGHRALSPDRSQRYQLKHLLLAGWERERIISRAKREIRRKLREEAKRQGWSRRQYLTERGVIYAIVTDFVHAIDDTARFSFWERLLAWWHLLHMPLVVILFLSGVAHVVAVHMY